MPFVDLKNDRLFYESRGEGNSVVLIHGAWASHAWWRWQIPELKKHYRVIAMDVRGHGRSTPLHAPTSVQDLARDLEAFLQQLSIDAPVLIGWSMGGLISMQYSFDHPQKVKALILMATSGHRIPRLKLRIYIHYLQALLGVIMDFSQPRKYNRVEQQFPGQNAWLAYQVRNMLSPAAPQEVRDWILSDITRNPRKNFFTVIKSLWDWEAGEKLAQIDIPTLVIAGELDSLAPPRFSRRLHNAIPNSKLVIVKNASHYLALERPKPVNAEILNFLKEIGH